MGKVGIYVRTSIDKDNTSIEQQIKLGKEFCKKKKLEYQIYEDIGKSGFKIEDENDPFKNRQGLINLINDIENKIIDKVWVFEHSRLSRNVESSILLSRIFNKYKIIIYEQDRQFDLNDPHTQMIQGILTNISQYERHLITSRTIRGVHDTINRGIRGFNELYGYKKDAKNEEGYMIWKPVNSEIENIRYSFEKYLEGNSIYSIITDIYKNKLTEKNRTTLKNKWKRILRQFVYTGYSLTTDGIQLYNRFMNMEIESIKEIKNKKYYVKSVSFPIKIISIENWIKTVEKLQVRKTVYKDKMRSTETEMLTGIMGCPYCELRYYVTNDKGFIYYKHFPKKLCGQKPKSVRVEKLDKYFEVFFFYYYLVFDDMKVLIEESQKRIKIDQLEIVERIKSIETENKRLEKQIDRFQNIYDDSNDKELLKLTLKKETELNNKKEKNIILLENLKTELEGLVNKFDKDKLELTFYDVKETIINFFENMTNDEKRMSLVKIIKNCQLFEKYIVVDTGKLLFIFNLNKECILTEKTYNKFKKDKNFKDNFLNSSSVIDDEGKLTIIKNWENYNKNNKKKTYKELSNKEKIQMVKNLGNYYSVRILGDISIQEIFLNDKNKVDIRIFIENKLQNVGIDYQLSNIEKIVNFTDLDLF
jgi:DNA invertase Pin-like site-specific DNA recombinase